MKKKTALPHAKRAQPEQKAQSPNQELPRSEGMLGEAVSEGRRAAIRQLGFRGRSRTAESHQLQGSIPRPNPTPRGTARVGGQSQSRPTLRSLRLHPGWPSPQAQRPLPAPTPRLDSQGLTFPARHSWLGPRNAGWEERRGREGRRELPGRGEGAAWCRIPTGNMILASCPGSPLAYWIHLNSSLLLSRVNRIC